MHGLRPRPTTTLQGSELRAPQYCRADQQNEKRKVAGGCAWLTACQQSCRGLEPTLPPSQDLPETRRDCCEASISSLLAHCNIASTMKAGMTSDTQPPDNVEHSNSFNDRQSEFPAAAGLRLDAKPTASITTRVAPIRQRREAKLQTCGHVQI
ncbi:hypothetical protein EW146_g6068 [Bondarzewia mesenterica]|uniref:Uncharacterized protein n=1 Tax=Bondarzewia mesenterica TaxID=1095465 RepID=A0A4S4LPP3_9AGAM|nr:hypothetical protein EW146_g6068 [Bondarzewia mesenterica]